MVRGVVDTKAREGASVAEAVAVAEADSVVGAVSVDRARYVLLHSCS
jgi:hypothetical protein